MVSRLRVGRILVLLFVQVILCVIEDPTSDFCLKKEHITSSGIAGLSVWRRCKIHVSLEGRKNSNTLGATSYFKTLTFFYLYLYSLWSVIPVVCFLQLWIES